MEMIEVNPTFRVDSAINLKIEII